MKYKMSLLIACLAMTACSASQVKTEIPETSRYAPVNDKADGEVSYLNAGAKTVRDARRQDAYKKCMSTAEALTRSSGKKTRDPRWEVPSGGSGSNAWKGSRRRRCRYHCRHGLDPHHRSRRGHRPPQASL